MPTLARTTALLFLLLVPAYPAFAVEPWDRTTGLTGEPVLVPEASSALPASVGARARPASRRGAPLPDHEIASTWAMLRVGTKGIQEVRGADLEAAGFDLNAYDPRNFRLYVRPGLPLLAEDEFDADGGLAEVAMRVDGASDGSFDPADRLFFWGLAASGWHDEYGVTGAAPEDWLDHPYESHNVYWLALDPIAVGSPARWGSRDVAPVRSDAAPVDTFRARLHLEDNRSYVETSYELGLPWDRWAARRLNSSEGPVSFVASLDGVVAGAMARVRGRLWGVRNASSPSSPHDLSLRLNDAPLALRQWSGGVRSDVDTTSLGLVDGTNRLTLTLAAPPPPFPGFPSGFDQIVFHWWEIHFARRFVASADSLEYIVPPVPAVGAFTLAPFSTAAVDSIHLLDVSDPLAPIALVGATPFDTEGGLGVRLHDDRPGSRIFVAAVPAWHRPFVERATIRGLRQGGGDYVVICVDTLAAAARRLADFRRSYPPFPGAISTVVHLSDVYAAYSGGRTDPTAIRNFLHEAAGGAWSPAPSYVCLMGDATTDLMDRFGVQAPGANRRWLPTHDAFLINEAFENDAWFGDLDLAADEDGDVPEIAVGRLPARSSEQAFALVVKAEDGELRQPRATDAGGNRLFWSVDDASQRSEPDPIGGEFTAGVEMLDREHVPAWVERRKVNLLEHMPAADGTKPSGRDSLVAELRRGTIAWFYVGRGGGFKLADEDFFRIDDASALGDVARLPFFVATTSAAGGFSAPFTSLLAESLVLQSEGGVLGAFASGANTFVFANQELGRAILDAMFVVPSPPGGPTLGSIAVGAARGAFARANNRSYNLLGDPASRVRFPPRDLRFALFDDVTGEALVDSIPRGRRIRIEGELLTGRGDPPVVDEGGTGLHVKVSIDDAPPVHGYPTFGGTASYEGNADRVQETTTLSSEGRFSATLVVPVGAKAGLGARVQAVSRELPHAVPSASGAIRLSLGAIRPDPADTTGPSIRVWFRTSGSLVAPNAEYQIRFEDASGLFLPPLPSEHRVTVALDDSAPVDITDRIVEVTGGGWLHVDALPALEDGDHVLRVAASDHLADPHSGAAGTHRTERTIEFRVATYLATPGVDARALPNPFSPEQGTTLVLRSDIGPGKAEVDIHDVLGRRVRTLGVVSGASPFMMTWDGRDDHGRRLAPGVYPWRGIVTGTTEPTSQRFDGRLVLLR